MCCDDGKGQHPSQLQTCFNPRSTVEVLRKAPAFPPYRGACSFNPRSTVEVLRQPGLFIDSLSDGAVSIHAAPSKCCDRFNDHIGLDHIDLVSIHAAPSKCCDSQFISGSNANVANRVCERCGLLHMLATQFASTNISRNCFSGTCSLRAPLGQRLITDR